MCSTAASSFGREGISVATGWGSHGEARGCAVSSTVAVGGVHWCSGRRSRTRREGDREGCCQLQSYSRGFCREVAKWLGIGKEEGQRVTTGWDGGRERSRRAYFLCLCCRRTITGGRAASLWRAVMGVEVKALRIFRRAEFCCSCSLRARTFCPDHQISAPKSDLDSTHAR
jgi:hypothetical protein